MFNLIVKDILIQKKQLIFGFLYILVIIATFQSIGSIMYTTGVVAFAYMMLLTSCAYEDKNKTDILLNCLPVKRSRIVASKYLSAFVFMLIGTISYLLVFAVINALALPITVYPITLEGFVGGFVAIGLIVGLYLPIFFKIGYMKSRFLQLIIFFSFFFGVSFLARFIVSHMDQNSMKPLLDFYNSQASAAMLMTIMAMLLFLFASYGLSVWFYRRREL